MLVGRRGGLLSYLDTYPLCRMDGALFQAAIFLLLTVRRLPFLRVLVGRDHRIDDDFVFPNVRIGV